MEINLKYKMYKAVTVFFILFLFSCGTEQKKIADKQSIKEHKDTTGTLEGTVNNNGIFSDPGEDKMTESYKSIFHDVKGTHEYFQSGNIDSLIKKREKPIEYDESGLNYKLDYFSKNEMIRMPVKELVYYCMKYPASYSQICVAFMDTLRFRGDKIFARVPFQSTEFSLSKIQKEVLQQRRDEVVASIQGYLKEGPGQLYRDCFDLMILLNAWETFPEVIQMASEKNLICYSYLLEMMQENKYTDFLKHKMHNNLFGEEMFYYSGGMESNEENRSEIIRLAENFYKKRNAL